jgi:hypothetical protein
MLAPSTPPPPPPPHSRSPTPTPTPPPPPPQPSSTPTRAPPPVDDESAPLRRSPRLSSGLDPSLNLSRHPTAKKGAEQIANLLYAHLLKTGGVLAADCPRGPWVSFGEAMRALSAWALVNGFKLIKDSRLTEATSKSGAKGSLACNFVRAESSSATQRQTTSMGELGDKCHFRISLEESFTGWAILSANTCHSEHPLKPIAEATAAALGAGDGKIPKQLLEAGSMLRCAYFGAEDIDRLLKSEAKKAKLPVNWSIDDVYNTFCRDGKEADTFDAQRLIDSLNEREKDGFPCEYRLTASGELASVFWVNDTGFK